MSWVEQDGEVSAAEQGSGPCRQVCSAWPCWGGAGPGALLVPVACTDEAPRDGTLGH